MAILFYIGSKFEPNLNSISSRKSKKHQFMHFNYTKGFPYPLTDQCDRLGDGVPLDLDNDFVDMMSSRHFDFFL